MEFKDVKTSGNFSENNSLVLLGSYKNYDWEVLAMLEVSPNETGQEISARCESITKIFKDVFADDGWSFKWTVR